ncbi:VanZ family protein [Sporomusa sphaeroides]|uniref:VanZ family protein n=1 Tax=Sporomusa sphaeroides TaxID=47679 RepID=UPI002C673E85|nr:VanZ family protein [Sporomusa sphaeroides]HML34191.1 VanZ family protein [Sporomusa sphaeroides]
MRKVSFLLFCGWIVLIIWFSAQPAEQSRLTSGIVVKALVNTVTALLPNATGIQEQHIHNLVRKVAHAVNYFILGCLAYHALRLNLRLRQEGWLMAGAIVFCISFAMFDEFYQTYVPGRGGELRDVLVDSVSALAGSLLCRVYHQRQLTPGKKAE